MITSMKRVQKKWRQKGAILAFTALLLPMIIVGVGLAVDLGNIYVQHARLQNAADAAALAGAAAFAENNDKPEAGKHKHADAKAREYIKGIYHNLEQDEDITNYEKDDKIFKAAKDNHIIYYKVILEKEVPLYFLGSFYEKIKEKNTFTVSAESVASITYKNNSASNNPFKNLFTFKESLETLNVMAFDPNNKTIQTTFKGNIVHTKDNSIVQYNGTDTSVKLFFPTETKGKKANDKDVQEKGHTAIYQNLDIYSYADNLKKEYSGSSPSNRENDNFKLPVEDIKKTDYYIKNANEFFVDMSKNMSQISNEPIRITIDSASNPKIYLNNNSSNEKQPIIYSYLGTNPVVFEGSGGSFYGIIYAPYAKVYCNDNNFKFYGSIISDSIRVEANGAQYEFKDYSQYIPASIFDNSAAQGSETPTGDYSISLSQPPNIKW